MNLDVALGLSDPALITRWFVHLPDITDPFQTFVESIELPFPKLAAKPRYGHARNTYYPDMEDIDAITVNMYETDKFDAQQYVQRWYDKVRDRNDNYGVPRDYKRRLESHLFHRDRNEPVAKVVFTGAWPTDRNPISLNYEDVTGRIIHGFQLQVDRQPEVIYT